MLLLILLLGLVVGEKRRKSEEIGNDYRCWVRLRPRDWTRLCPYFNWTAGARGGGVALCLRFSLNSWWHKQNYDRYRVRVVLLQPFNAVEGRVKEVRHSSKWQH